MERDYNEKLTQEQVAATIAHEIKNPLALIRATLQYVELGDTQKLYKQKYDIIYREIDRLNDLVVNFIDIANPEKLVFRVFEISELLSEIEQIFRETIKIKGIKLTISATDRRLMIKGDYNKIKQVVINLITNSIEALEELSDGEIIISARREGVNVAISVADNGHGIANDHINSIGEPFFTTKEKGTGLGILISREIIKMHNGVLSISGKEGQGVVITITLPLLLETNHIN